MIDQVVPSHDCLRAAPHARAAPGSNAIELAHHSGASGPSRRRFQRASHLQRLWPARHPSLTMKEFRFSEGLIARHAASRRDLRSQMSRFYRSLKRLAAARSEHLVERATAYAA